MSDIKYDPAPEDLTAWELWLSERPAQVVELARKLPPWNCYRLRVKNGNLRGHYMIHSYNENGTVTLTHGRDSFLPGVGVFGVKPDEVVPCGCRRWFWPTEEQCSETERRIEMERQARNDQPN